MVDFFIRYFLILPKIQITEGRDYSTSQGILVGEIFLLFFFGYNCLFPKKLVIPTPLVLLILFLFYLVVISSYLNFPFAGILPIGATVYFGRLLLYFGIFLGCYYYHGMGDKIEDTAIVNDVFLRPFVIQFLFGSLIVAVYYVMHTPSLNDILWVYGTGLKLIPFSGLTFDSEGFFFLKPVGGGSGNILCSWALAILILADNFDIKRKRTVILLVVLTALLSFSRGGLITICIYLVYMFLREGRLNLAYLRFIPLVVVAVIVLTYVFAGKETLFSNIFTRFSNTLTEGKLDYSSASRLENYQILWATWIKNPLFMIFGMGYDESIVKFYTGQTVIESFYLLVLFCSGIVGLGLLLLFFFSVFKHSRENLWFNALWKFIIFESLVMWTITGGDFFASNVLYMIMAFLGFGFRDLTRPYLNTRTE